MRPAWGAPPILLMGYRGPYTPRASVTPIDTVPEDIRQTRYARDPKCEGDRVRERAKLLLALDPT